MPPLAFSFGASTLTLAGQGRRVPCQDKVPLQSAGALVCTGLVARATETTPSVTERSGCIPVHSSRHCCPLMIRIWPARAETPFHGLMTMFPVCAAQAFLEETGRQAEAPASSHHAVFFQVCLPHSVRCPCYLPFSAPTAQLAADGMREHRGRGQACTRTRRA